jgi:hypothetical protein
MNSRQFACVAVLTIGSWMPFLAVSAAGQASTGVGAAARARQEAPAAPWTPPRTPDGQPDISGTWTNFDPTPFEAPDPEEDAKRLAALRKWFPPGDGTGPSPDFGDGPGAAKPNPRRRSLVVDPPNGRVPVRPEAEAKKDYALAHLTDSWEFHTPWERCITRGIPGAIFPGGYGSGYQILQVPGYVVILYEMIHEARIIPIDGRPHVGPNIRLWNGDSRGRWEGNTLVVEIANYNDKGPIASNIASQAMRNISQSDALRVVERFTPVGPDTINYEVTIEDPKTFTRPWKLAVPLNRDAKYQLYEYACHEGNYAIPNTLSGARAQEAEEAARKARSSHR